MSCCLLHDAAGRRRNLLAFLHTTIFREWGKIMAREAFQTLTEPMYYILLALTEECCGVDIMNKVEKMSRGRIRVGPGTLYAMLARFEKNQIIRLTAEDGRRKSYVITDTGIKMLTKEYARLRTMVEDGEPFMNAPSKEKEPE